MISTILSVITGSYGKLRGIGAVVVGICGYIWYLSSSLDSALVDKKYAEDNVVLVTYEFDRLYSVHSSLVEDTVRQKLYMEQSMAAIKEAHEVELNRAIQMAKMRGRITNVSNEDDGEVANVLSGTLNAIRMYN